ncbi:MAG: GIY-YIG nuclease family protein [Planctomycetes bacterium]|nr:GIY-YIG nuclease family protein [Planctomycetota bacterium]
MAKSAAFSLRIFVADGDPDGLQLVERTNWIGKAVVFPRSQWTAVRSRPEFQQTGVYLLVGPKPDGLGDMLYIGEGDPVADRFASHIKEKEFWIRAVFFVAPGFLNKAHVQLLEARLIAKAREAKLVALDNGNQPTEPTLSEADFADMEVFLSNILGILPVLGVDAFNSGASASEADGDLVFNCSGRGVNARGRDTAQGFVVLHHSEASADVVDSLEKHFPNVVALRSDLIKNGVLVPGSGSLRFSQDYVFNSPSLAAAVVLGRSSGLTDWKDARGRTLRDVQAEQATDRS